MYLRFVNRVLVYFLCAAVSIGATVYADTLHGEFTFSKKAPKVALVYLPEDTGLTAQVAEIDQRNKQFSQKLYVAPKGGQAVFKNSDSINHNIFADDKTAGVKFDVGLMPPGATSAQSVEWEDKVVRCGCKIHPKMKTWIASISSQYYQIIEFEKGKKEFAFDMNSFPENLSAVKVWIPKYDPIELNLAAGESKRIELKRRGKVKGSVTLTRK